MITVKTKDIGIQLSLISSCSTNNSLKGYETIEIGKDEYNRPVYEYLVFIESEESK